MEGAFNLLAGVALIYGVALLMALGAAIREALR